jgi:hypothetical protein
MPMLTGASPRMTARIGQRSTPTHNTVAAATAHDAAPAAPRARLPRPVAKVSPITIAATPSSIACTTACSPTRR